MSTPYRPGNEFDPDMTIADAAVDWEQIPQEELSNIVINDDGFPFHPNYPKLTARAEALYNATLDRKIDGQTYNAEYDRQIPIPSIRLNRDSVAEFIKATEKRLSAKKPLPRLADEAVGQRVEQIERLLTLEDLKPLVKLGRSTIYEKMKKNEFPKNTHDRPTRWRYSDIANYITNQSINAAKGNSPKTTDAADIKEAI